MVVVDGEKSIQKPISFLNKYINEMKNNENEEIQQKQQLKKRVHEYDEACLQEIEGVFRKHKDIVRKLLEGGMEDQFFGIDTNFIKNSLQSKLHAS